MTIQAAFIIMGILLIVTGILCFKWGFIKGTSKMVTTLLEAIERAIKENEKRGENGERDKNKQT